MSHLRVLDGWRGISILCVLAGHMMPLGPKPLQFNAMVATTGMSLFFILSGFLIVSMLLRNDSVGSFLVRRVCRIVPLAWAFLIVVLWVNDASPAQWSANLLFYANLPPFYLSAGAEHFWSLSVEMQFYAAIALTVGLLGRRGLYGLPIACLGVTAARIIYSQHISIVTWFRVDEILAGGCLALALNAPQMAGAIRRLPVLTPMVAAPLLLASCHPALAAVNYARPYLAALLIGSTILRPSDALQRLLCGTVLSYLAKISFALYVIHPLTCAGWMGVGGDIARAGKRIASLALSLCFAHASTFTYERFWIALGHRLAARTESRIQPPSRAVPRPSD